MQRRKGETDLQLARRALPRWRIRRCGLYDGRRHGRTIVREGFFARFRAIEILTVTAERLETLIDVCRASRTYKRRRAFSLIELLVVMVVLALLMSLALRMSAVRSSAQNLACIANLHQLQMCTTIYAGEYRALPPHAAPWPDRRVKEIGAPQGSWWCPADVFRGQHNSSYSYWPERVTTWVGWYELQPDSALFHEYATPHPWGNAIRWNGVVFTLDHAP